MGEGTQASYSQLSYLAEQSDVLKLAGFETGYIHGLTQLCRNAALVLLLWPLVLLREQSLTLFMLLFAVLALWSICRVLLDLKSDSPLFQIVATFIAASALWGIASWYLTGAIGWATPVLALAAGAGQATLLVFAGYLRFYEHAGAAFHVRRLFHSHVVASSVVVPVPRVASIERTDTPCEATGQMLVWRNVLQGSEPIPYGETDEEGWKRIDLVLARVRESLRGGGAQRS